MSLNSLAIKKFNPIRRRRRKKQRERVASIELMQDSISDPKIRRFLYCMDLNSYLEEVKNIYIHLNLLTDTKP